MLKVAIPLYTSAQWFLAGKYIFEHSDNYFKQDIFFGERITKVHKVCESCERILCKALKRPVVSHLPCQSIGLFL